MSKAKSSKKKFKTADVAFDFYVAQNGAGEYLVDWNNETKTPTFGTNLDAAFWSTKGSKVTTFITQNNINNATTVGKNGDHPSQRPPL